MVIVPEPRLSQSGKVVVPVKSSTVGSVIAIGEINKLLKGNGSPEVILTLYSVVVPSAAINPNPQETFVDLLKITLCGGTPPTLTLPTGILPKPDIK